MGLRIYTGYPGISTMAVSPAVDDRLENEILDIIAEEVGVSRDELCDDTEFAYLGIDDLLSKSIISRITKALNLQLPQTTFQEYPNVESLRVNFHKVANSLAEPTVSVPVARRVEFTTKPAGPLSVLLQGKPSSARKTIFLLPDGSGSGMAYIRVPTISPDVCLIGINSPFLNAAEQYTCRLEDLAPIWVKEIRQRQPFGPYVLGGWSAGGYYSFEVAKQLIREGETVEKLILIDSPCRLVFEELPMEVIRYLSSNDLMGNWGSKRTPDWLIKHFQSSIDTIASYMPTQMDSGNLPEVFIIWASEGVLQNADATATSLDLTVKITRFMIEERTDFGPHGWERLFPGATLSIAKMPGNHFTIVHPPDVSSPHSATLIISSYLENIDIFYHSAFHLVNFSGTLFVMIHLNERVTGG